MTGIEFDPSVPSTLAGAIAQSSGQEGVVSSEVDIIREVLGAIQGRETSGLFSMGDDGSVNFAFLFDSSDSELIIISRYYQIHVHYQRHQ